MKKLLLTLVVLMATTLSATAGIDFGVTAGYNLTNFKADKSTLNSTLTGKNGSGWYIGPKVSLGLVMGLSVDGAAVYNHRSYEMEGLRGVNLKKDFNSIDVPLNAKFTLPLAAVGVYVSTGPQFSFAMGDKSLDLGTLVGDGSVLQRENISTTWNVGAGVRVLGNLELGLAYNFAVGETGKHVLEKLNVPSSVAHSGYKLNTFSVQASYYF